MKWILLLLSLVSSLARGATAIDTNNSVDVHNRYDTGTHERIQTVIIDGTSDTIGVFTQGPPADLPWPMTDTTTASALVPLTLTAHISDTLDAILAASGGGSGDILTIDGTGVANQSNAPGSMPSANLDGYGNPITSYAYDGGRYLTSFALGAVRDFNSSSIYEVAGTLDGYNAAPWSDQRYVGGVALSPALDLSNAPFDANDSIVTPMVGAASFGFNQADFSWDYTGTTRAGGNGDSALWQTMKVWGDALVSDAFDVTGGYLDSTNPLYAPPVASIAWAKSDVDTNFYNVNSSAVGPGGAYQGLMVKNYAGTDNQTDTFTTAVPGTTRNFTAQNRTWQVGSDDPASVGLAFSITLEISIDGGTRWAVIDTKTEANVTDAPTTIANKPGAIYRTNCGSLTLGLTATNVTASVLAAM